MDTPMAWMGYNQAYNPHLRGAMAANGTGAHQHPQNVHHPHHHPPHLPHPSMAAHYRQNSHASSSSGPAIPGHQLNSGGAPSSHTMSAHGSQFGQHQESMFQTCAPEAYDDPVFVSARQGPTSHHTHPHYSGSASQKSAAQHSAATAAAMASQSHLASKQHLPQFSHFASAAHYGSSSNLHSKQSNSSSKSSAKHTTTTPSSFPSPNTSDVSVAAAAAAAAAFAAGANFDSSSYYRCAAASNTTTTPTTDPYQSGSNPWSIFNSTTSEKHSHQQHLSSSSSSTSSAATSTQHHLSQSHAQSQSKQSPNVGHTSASTAFDSFRISSNVVAAAAVAAAAAQSGLEQQCHLNSFMNQNPWAPPQSQQASTTNHHHSQHPHIAAPSKQSCYDHVNPTSMRSKAMSTSNTSNQSQQIKSASDIPSARYSTADYNGIFHSAAAAAWSQNYSAMAKASAYQQQCGDMTMLNGFPKTPSATPQMTSQHAANSSKTASCTPSPHGQQPPPGSTNLYANNYGQCSGQSSHFPSTNSSGASPYFPMMSNAFSAAGAGSADPYFAAMAMEHRKRQQQQQQFQQQQQQQHQQQQQQQHQNSQHSLHSQHHSYPQHHQQQQQHSSKYSSMNSMIGENQTQQLMNYSNSFFEHASNNQQPQQQSQPEAVVTSTSNTKKKRAPRKSRAVAASAAIPAAAATSNQSTPIMMPEFNAYSNGYGAACSGGAAVMQQQQPQQSKRSVSRCSSVSSQHHQPQQQQQSLNRSTESVASHYTNNYSPATASGHSPYHSGASSQTCLGGSTASSGNDVGYYSSGTVFPSQTPTPTPGGYPTPPSSVGQNSNPRCNSNGELSPYSSNSMSSNMSQSYTNPGSSKTVNSQISPVHNHEPIEPIIGLSGQFVSSCMMQKTQIVEDFYQSQPNNTGFATSQGTSYPVNGECDSVTTVQQNGNNTNNELYLEYGNSETVVQGASNNVNTNGYGQHQFDGHYESEEYSHAAEPSTELPSCSKARGQVVSGPIDTVMAVADTKDFHSHQHQHHHQSEHHPESFNLNFDSVIQPIEPQHHPQQELADPLIQTSGECETSSILLPSIDEFIVNDDQKPHPRPSSSAEIVSQDYHHHLLQNDSSQSQNCLQATIAGTAPTVSGNIIDDDEPMVECSQIHSIINSLPQSADEVEETEAVAAVVSAQQSFTSSEADKIEASIPAIIETTPSVDVYLSDLAPLFADSSKIALMESTFTDVVVAHNDVVTPISDADVDIKLDEEEDHGIDDDNSQRLKDFDEFLISEGVHTEPEVTAPEPENLEENLQTTTVLADATESAPEPFVECSEQESLRKKLKIEDESKKVEPQIQKEKKIKRKANDCTDSGSQTESKILDTPVQQLCQSKPEEPSSAKKRKIAVVHPKSKEVKKEVEMIVEPIKKPTKKESKSNKVNKETKESTKKSPKTKTNNKNRLAEISSNNKTLAAKLMLEDPVAKPKKVKPAKPIEAKQAASTSPNSRMEAKENDSSKKVVSTKKSPASKAKIIPKIEISPVQTIPLMVKPPMLSTPFDLNHLQPQVQPKIVKSLPKPKQISPKPKKMPMKEVAISPKPAAGALKSTPISIQSSQNSGLLSPIAPGLSVPNKAKTPPTSFATPNVTNAPTLIMNQNGAQPYQMSPMTNAVLISIHPTLHPTNSSLAPSSTFILNPQNVSNSNGTPGTTNGALTTQTSVSRRKSQDKKLTTIREGLMRTGDFVVAEDEAQLGNPVIWRIEGKSLLQRFESTDQNGQTVYVNTSSYSAWNPTVREKYLGLDVRILGCNRSRTVVEKIGLTSSKKNELMNISIPEKEAVGVNGKTLEKSGASDKIASGNLVGYLEKFEVYMQTLVSQALDPSFIAEIVKDNDEYFLSHIKSIDDLCVERKTRFLTKQKWDLNLVKSIDAFPKTQIHQQSDVGDLRCRLCHDNWSTKILQFEGDVYDYKTLELQEPNADQKQTKLALCDSCTDKAFLYSKIHHQKYNFYIDCKTKVQNILTQDENKDSRDILEECLVDADWIKQLFAKFETMIATCERYST